MGKKGFAGEPFFRRPAIAAVVVAVLMVTGCGGSSDTDSSNGDPSPDANPAIVEAAVCPGTASAIENPVVYLAQVTPQTSPQLFVADSANPSLGSTVLNPSLSGEQSIRQFVLAPNNRCVFYIADHSAVGRFELFVVDIANPGIVNRVNPVLGDFADVEEFVLNSDGSEVIYRADQLADGRRELFLVRTDSPGNSEKVNAELGATGGVASNEFQFSPDDTMILYAADPRIDGVFELFLVQRGVLGVAADLNPPFQSFVDLAGGSTFSPDSQWVAYAADQEIDDIRELYVVPVSSPGFVSSSFKVNPGFTADEDICSFEFHPDSQSLAYCADQDSDDILELYVASISTLQLSTKINAVLVEGGQVRPDFAYTPDGSRLVYRADQEVAGRTELYSVPLDMPGIAGKLNDTLGNDGDVLQFEIRPDSAAVGYLADQDSDGVVELYESGITTTGGAMKLNAPVADDGIEMFEYSASGESALYLADQQDDGIDRIYRVETSTPGASTRISALTLTGDVLEFTQK